MAKKSLLKTLLHPLLMSRSHYFRNLLAPFVKPYRRMLDIGCGDMLVSSALHRFLGITVQGVDVLNMNQTALPHKTYDGHTLPYKSDAFDISLLVGVLHHTPRPLRVLQEAKRVTRHRLCIFEDVYSSPLEKVWLSVRDVLGNALEEPRMNFAFSFQTAEQWEQWFQQERLRIVHRRAIRSSLTLSKHMLYVLNVE